MYLVDTSIWIDFLRGENNRRVQFLEGLLEEGEAHLCEITFAEICFGAQDKKQLKKYRDYFGALPFLYLPNHWHHRAGEMGYVLRSKGHQPFMADILIALTALESHAILLTRDKDFEIFKELFGLTLE